MITKQEITDLITDNFLDGTRKIAITHRKVLKDDPKSFLEHIYGTPLVDTENTSNFFTLNTIGSATYRLEIMKQGRFSIISGEVTPTIDGLVILGNITDPSLASTLDKQYFGIGVVNNTTDSFQVTIKNTGGITTINFSDGIPKTKTLTFGIIYNSNL